jgi:hypothetical protein
MTTTLQFTAPVRVFAPTFTHKIFLDLYLDDRHLSASIAPADSAKWIATNLQHEGATVYALAEDVPVMITNQWASALVDGVNMTSEVHVEAMAKYMGFDALPVMEDQYD